MTTQYQHEDDYERVREVLRQCADGLVRDVDYVGDSDLPGLVKRARLLVHLAESELPKDGRAERQLEQP